MFNKNSEIDFSNVETIIGPSVKVEGDFQGQGNVVVEGSLSGGIKTGGNVRIGDKAEIKANIEAKNAVIAGIVDGNITAEEVISVMGTARVNGDIKAKGLEVESGASIVGHCSIIPGEAQE